MKLHLLLAALCLFTSLAIPQQPSATPHPRIGLVLEGGGALGIAHIGVIRWLEENHIPVRYLAGTSMGALVGGLYATGNDPAQLQQIVNSIDWDAVLSDQIPYQDLAYRRKQDYRDYPNALELGLQSGLRLPSGFNSGYQVGLILDRYMLPYSDIKNFDQLPIPFRCVAVDLVSRQKYVFDSGPVAQAMRASMSLPAFFSPVSDRQHIYVDGGLLDNLPVDVGRAMGADLVLAVHLQTKPLSPGATLSSFGVMSESVSVVVAANELASMQKADLLVSVDVSDFSSTDYQDVNKLIARGYEAAKEKASILRQFSVDDATWNQYVAERNSRRINVVQQPEFVAVQGATPDATKMIQRDLKKLTGRPLDYTKLNQDLTRIVGTGRFSTLDYSLAQQQGQTGLLISAAQKQSPILINPLIAIDGSEIQNVRFALGARLTKFGTGESESEWRTDLAFGSEYGLSTDYFRPFRSVPGWFIDPGIIANTSPFDVYYRNTQIAAYRMQKVSGYFDAGYMFGRSSELRFGYELGYLTLKQQVGSPVLGNLGDRLGESSVSYHLDLVDDPVVPHEGETIDSHFSWFDTYLGVPSAFPSAEIRGARYQPVSSLGTVFTTFSGGTDFGYTQSGLPSFSLGDPLRLAAYGRNELLTNQYALIQAGYLEQIVKFPAILGKGIYAYGEVEGGRVYNQRNESQWPADGVLGMIVQTAFGPVIAGGSYGTTGHKKFFFQVGRVF
ncbi:MAG TPA: patatin-like phospholipase family protein [Terriglobales bacterium]|nr:patatin-like phospholipase family protein [Terriglobales bacterium]